MLDTTAQTQSLEVREPALKPHFTSSFAAIDYDLSHLSGKSSQREEFIPAGTTEVFSKTRSELSATLRDFRPQFGASKPVQEGEGQSITQGGLNAPQLKPLAKDLLFIPTNSPQPRPAHIPENAEIVSLSAEGHLLRLREGLTPAERKSVQQQYELQLQQNLVSQATPTQQHTPQASYAASRGIGFFKPAPQPAASRNIEALDLAVDTSQATNALNSLANPLRHTLSR